LTGRKVYTGPLPFDTRLKVERALAALGVKHNYTQVDLSTAGSQLESSAIEGMLIYTAGETQPAPWITEASLAVDWAALNPSDDEIATLKKKGFQLIDVPPSAFRRDVHTPKATLLPFYWGFNVGLEMPADEQNAAHGHFRNDLPSFQFDHYRKLMCRGDPKVIGWTPMDCGRKRPRFRYAGYADCGSERNSPAFCYPAKDHALAWRPEMRI
jgi:hypothetical protein